jgi:prepilin-type N-terminal cleavage/methylation domain-containing protein
MFTYRQKPGFTLAELLIALAILGVIATFTIPKVLVSQQASKKSLAAKEVAFAVAQAWNTYKMNNPTSGDTKLTVLAPYLNYVQVYTSGEHGDAAVSEGAMSCGSSAPCYEFANGAVLQLADWMSFGGTASTNAVGFIVDPDGTYSGSTTGEGKGVEFSLYYNGRLATWGTVAVGTQFSGGNYTPCPSCDPEWFSW